MKGKVLLRFAPFVLLVFLIVVFAVSLFAPAPPDRLQSQLINEALPPFALPAIPHLMEGGEPVEGFTHEDVLAEQELVLINIWASWCLPCRAEHPLLLKLAKGGIKIYGINYKDSARSARLFLRQLGNPFRRVGFDASGRTAIALGVYGIPESYLISRSGHVLLRHAGPLTEEMVDKILTSSF